MDIVFKQLAPFSYRVMNVKLVLGDMRLEPGDIIYINLRGEKYTLPIMKISYGFDGGFWCNLTSYGKMPNQLLLSRVSEKLSQITMGTNIKLNKVEETTKAFATAAASMVGCYEMEEVLPNGMKIHYWHDQPRLEDSKYIRKSNAEGFFFTTDGLNSKNWKGIDKNANALLESLTAKMISADTIKAGMLRSLNGKTWIDMENGRFNFSDNFVLDANNNATLRCDKLETLNGDYNLIMRDNQIVLPRLISAWEKQGITLDPGTPLSELKGQAIDFIRRGEVIGSVCFTDYDRLGNVFPLLNIFSKGAVFNVGEFAPLSINGNGINTTGVYVSSTEDIKENITESKNALSLLKKAKVFNYTLKPDAANSKTKKHGFIIDRGVPKELLSDDGKHVDLYSMVSVLWEALQEAEGRIKKLEER